MFNNNTNNNERKPCGNVNPTGERVTTKRENQP